MRQSLPMPMPSSKCEMTCLDLSAYSYGKGHGQEKGNRGSAESECWVLREFAFALLCYYASKNLPSEHHFCCTPSCDLRLHVLPPSVITQLVLTPGCNFAFLRLTNKVATQKKGGDHLIMIVEYYSTPTTYSM
jgi:hypothetical protein